MWRRVGHDSAVLGTSALLIALLQAGFRLLAIHELSVEVYGRAALLISVFNGFVLFGNFGSATAAARLAARSTGQSRGRELLAAATTAAAVPSALACAVVGIVTYGVTGSVLLACACACGLAPMIVSVILAGFIRGKGLVYRAAAIQPANAFVQLAMLGALGAVGIHVGLGWVLISFCIGNVAALLLAFAFITEWLRGPEASESNPDPEATPRRILSFGTWLAVSAAALLALTILPRVALARVSYADVAVFDLALLIYTLPQRLTASLVLALVPVASSQQAKDRQLIVPSVWDVLALAAGFAVLDGVLWWTHALKRLLMAVGLADYARAEHVLLIVFLAAPAELFFSINSGILQAFGRSRRLATITVATLAVSTALAPLAVSLGASYLAALLALDYWGLYFASRAFGPGATERSVIARLLPSARPRHVPA
jgi:O-antigen/teichoic acid export membrane protein